MGGVASARGRGSATGDSSVGVGSTSSSSGRRAGRGRGGNGGGVRRLSSVAGGGLRNRSVHGVAASGGAGLSGLGGGGRSRSGGRLGGGVAGTSLDTKLGAVLVLASHIVDDLDAVAGRTIGEGQVRGGSPRKAAAVGNALGKSRAKLDNVGRRALEEKDRDGVGRGGLPGDGELLTRGDNLGRVGQFRLLWLCLWQTNLPRSKDG